MKDKRAQQPNHFNQRLLYLIIGMAIVIAVFIAGIVFGGNNNNPPEATLQLEATVVTETPITVEEATVVTATPIPSDSNTVDLPELQTQWAQLGITRTAVNESNVTPTPE